MLVVRPDHLGDLLLLTPAIRLLRVAHPSAHLTALIGPWGHAVLRDNPHLDDVLTWDFPWFNRKPMPSALANVRSLIALARALRQRRYDAALIMRFDFWWGALACALAGVPVRIGYETPETRPFLTRALPRAGRRHEAERNLALVRAFTLSQAERGQGPISPGESEQSPLHPREGQGNGLEFPIGEAERDEAARLLAENGVRLDEPVIAIHPGAGAWPKLWTVERFAAVADALVERYGGRVLLTGTRDEQHLIDGIRTHMRHAPIDLGGQTSLGVLGALFQRATVVIGVDSGPMHLAVAVGAPSVHLFGPIDPAIFGPYGDWRRHVVVRSGMACSPCDRLDWPIAEFEAHPCVRLIRPEAVIAAAEQAIHGQGPDTPSRRTLRLIPVSEPGLPGSER